MTRYTVAWHDSAQDELLRLWLAAVDRQAITNAANQIDRELSQDAIAKGMMADGELCELIVPPLRVLFSVSEPDRLVKVTTVAVL